MSAEHSPSNTEEPRVAKPWHRPSDLLPPRHKPLVIAWRYKGGWCFDTAKFTGKRWLEMIPETDNEEFSTPEYWQEIDPPGETT